MAHSRFRPPDHTKGDANTLGGYIAVHDRPAAFEGADGFSYSVEILVDETGDADAPYGAYLLFVRWARIGAQSPEGHLETDYLTTARTEEQARALVSLWSLSMVKSTLDELVAREHGTASPRRWWDAMREERGDEEDGE
jgi:hypothetical protein